MIQTIESLESFEQTLPEAPQPVGSYVSAVQSGNLIFTSGALPIENGQLKYKGKVGSFVVGVEQGQEAARLCCINQLSILKSMLGSLNRVERIVKLTGYVNSAPSFTQQPQVINGASDLLTQLFGEKGRHARAAVGVNALPMDATVELDLVVEVR